MAKIYEFKLVENSKGLVKKIVSQIPGYEEITKGNPLVLIPSKIKPIQFGVLLKEPEFWDSYGDKGKLYACTHFDEVKGLALENEKECNSVLEIAVADGIIIDLYDLNGKSIVPESYRTQVKDWFELDAILDKIRRMKKNG